MTSRPESGSNDRLRILVVDDDPIFRSLAVNRLSKLAHEVVEASDGAAAWSKLAHETFHLALVDLEMPYLKGNELIRCVRGHPRTSHLPMIVITSRNDAEAVRESLDSGATSFMTKPVNWSMFGNHIEYLLRLNRVSEEGIRAKVEAQQTLAAIAALAADLSAEFARSAERMSDAAQTALDAGTGVSGNERLTTALRALVDEVEQTRASLLAAVSALAQATEAPDPASLPNEPPLQRAS